MCQGWVKIVLAQNTQAAPGWKGAGQDLKRPLISWTLQVWLSYWPLAGPPASWGSQICKEEWPSTPKATPSEKVGVLCLKQFTKTLGQEDEDRRSAGAHRLLGIAQPGCLVQRAGLQGSGQGKGTHTKHWALLRGAFQLKPRVTVCGMRVSGVLVPGVLTE